MSYIIAIESDPKTIKDINEAWGDLSKSISHKLLIFNDLKSFKTEWDKPDKLNQVVALLIIQAEAISTNPVDTINALKEKYSCDVLVTLFDDPRYTKIADTWPVQNLLFKPFDNTIFKEHTRFAILKNQKVQTEYVHTTAAKAEIESLKKLKSLQLTEFGLKIDKTLPLTLGEVYKFYHPLFSNNKQQHIWGRVVSENESSYELLFAQLNPVTLGSIRKKIVAAQTKIRNAVWTGRSTSPLMKLVICINLTDEGQNAIVTDLLQRNFEDISFVEKKDLKGRAKVDLLITDVPMDKRQLDNQFESGMTIIHFITNKPIKRSELEERFAFDTVRLEKPLDKAILVKFVKELFPLMKQKDPAPMITIAFEEPLLLSTLIEIDEYSEAAIGFKLMSQIPLDTMMDIALTQEDEGLLKEMKAKVHFVDEKPRGDKTFYHQLILFGMKDEFLKSIRLWTLQRHIINSQNS